MNFPEIYSATGMMELIQKIGFLLSLIVELKVTLPRTSVKAVTLGRLAYVNKNIYLCPEF